MPAMLVSYVANVYDTTYTFLRLHTSKLKALRSFETSKTVYLVTRCNIPEDLNISLNNTDLNIKINPTERMYKVVAWFQVALDRIPGKDF